jgi:hypothetical protein
MPFNLVSTEADKWLYVQAAPAARKGSAQAEFVRNA